MTIELSIEQRQLLKSITEDNVLMTIAHLAIEEELIQLRDDGMWLGMHANGFTCNNRDGSPSGVMRFGTRHGLVLALEAIAESTPEQVRSVEEQLVAAWQEEKRAASGAGS